MLIFLKICNLNVQKYCNILCHPFLKSFSKTNMSCLSFVITFWIGNRNTELCFTESNSVVGDSAGVHTQKLLLKTERLKNLTTGWGVWDRSLKPKVGQIFQSNYPWRILWERLLYYCFLQAGSKVFECWISLPEWCRQGRLCCLLAIVNASFFYLIVISS